MTALQANSTDAAGFTLIEVLVALVILAAGLVAFYEFLGTSLHAADRVRATAAAYDRDQNALALGSTINPMATPDGIFNVGTYRIRWHAEPITAAKPSSSGGAFAIALYRVVLDFPDDREFAPVAVIKLGYHRAATQDQPSREPGN